MIWLHSTAGQLVKDENNTGLASRCTMGTIKWSAGWFKTATGWNQVAGLQWNKLLEGVVHYWLPLAVTHYKMLQKLNSLLHVMYDQI